ncbi:MAG: hypothetical protein IKY15_02025 [Clostridia bacterium]|nr:hypothetical protein [Clostridia bacterium]
MFVYVQENQLAQCIQNVSKIEVLDNNNLKALENQSFEGTIKNLINLFQSARLMPAFSVSLHNETIDALKEGKWLKLTFLHQQNVNGLLFDGLVFQINETSGMNLIREYEGKFEGRCLYLDFDETINLEDLIK